MTTNTAGGPAFPVVGHFYSGKLGGQLDHGMTLRDYFAAKAMQVSLTELWNQAVRDGKPHSVHVHGIAAKFSYEVADAMLNAREMSK